MKNLSETAEQKRLNETRHQKACGCICRLSRLHNCLIHSPGSTKAFEARWREADELYRAIITSPIRL